MKLTTEKRDVIKSQEFETINYGVDASNLPLLFQMLRTNLYSDIYGSIIREVASNVIDSHTEAKKEGAIGEIEWIGENRLLGVDNQLIIRDFGVGLSPERMKTVYGNYLSSTKRDANDQIGGFGLGSKVPFAYTDSFFVKTVFDGQEYKYLCYIDETQLGAISLLHKQDTVALNGTEIIVPIKDKWEQSRFQNAIFKQLSYFRNFKYIGFEAPSNKVCYEDEHCVIIDHPPYADLHLVLGNVAYPIDFNVAGFDMYNDQVRGCKVGLKFKIGELQPTLSRENIFWNDKVKKVVKDKTDLVRKIIRTKLEAELASEKDYLKWFANTANRKTKTFPDQWAFSKVKTDALYNPPDGSPALKMTSMPHEWFAGLNVRTVTTYQGYGRRRSKSGIKKDPDYTASAASMSDLSNELPVYQLAGPLSARKCLYLFKTHPKGFLAVSHIGLDELGDIKGKEAKPYYDQALQWMTTLPSYDTIVVPDGEFVVNSDVDSKEAYKLIQKQRKLEGKFTAKKLRVSSVWSRKLDEVFEYGQFESKFEDHKNDLIIYGYQEEHDLILKAAAILTYAKSNVRPNQDEFAANFVVLKIGRNYSKQFEMMTNAHYVKDVLGMKTTVNEKLADIVTAHKFEEKIDQYGILDHFETINHEMTVKFKELKKFILENTQNKKWHEIGLLREITKLCDDNGIANQEMVEYFEDVEAYFSGSELLKYVKFSSESIPAIKKYLLLTKGDTNGDTEVPGTFEDAVLAPAKQVKEVKEVEEVISL